MTPPQACIVGGRTRAPFAGHFRGETCAPGGVTLAWAGSLHASAAVEDAWSAAEAARDVLARLIPCWLEPSEALAAGKEALTALPSRWLAREDLVVLFVAHGPNGSPAALAAGLSEVWCAAADERWRRLDGLLQSDAGHWSPAAEVDGSRWIGVPRGSTFPTSKLDEHCGVHR